MSACIFINIAYYCQLGKKKRTEEGWTLKNFKMTVPFMYNIQNLSNNFPTIF